MARAFDLKVELDGKSYTNLMRALRVLGEEDAPHIRKALQLAGRRFTSEIGSRAPRAFRRFSERGVIGHPGGLKFSSSIAHPASRRMEFGRNPRPYGVTWKQANRRRGQGGKGGYVLRGQSPRPYVGIKSGGQAIGATAPYAKEVLTQAINDEWARIGGEG